jgi:hypothetical protein
MAVVAYVVAVAEDFHRHFERILDLFLLIIREPQERNRYERQNHDRRRKRVFFYKTEIGFRHIIVIPLENYDGGHPAPAGRALTNDLCGQYFKINVNVFISALAKINSVLAKIILTLNDYIIFLPRF